MFYVATSARNGPSRSIDHVSNNGRKKVSKGLKEELRNARKTEAEVTTMIIRHGNKVHNGEFEMKIMKTFQDDAMGRQSAEGILIRDIPPEQRINNKEEWEQPSYSGLKAVRQDNRENKEDKEGLRENEKPKAITSIYSTGRQKKMRREEERNKRKMK